MVIIYWNKDESAVVLHMTKNKRGGLLMEFMEVIKRRHSIRKFKPEPVSQEAIESILEAGRMTCYPALK
jgi:vacuolar-type H+-ATPase subunit D/Vma8